MNENLAKPNNLVDTTDCLEAVNVFKGWKNFFFIIVILCLLLLQVSFWLVETDFIKTGDDATNAPSSAVVKDSEEIKEAAEKVTGEPNQPTEAAPQPPEQQKKSPLFEMTPERLAWVIRFVNFVLILVAILYCLTMLFALKVSLLGRLGGINYICRAFFLSLVFVVLLLPWQRFFAGVVFGAMYTPDELLSRCTAAEDYRIFGIILHYLRFTGFWLLVLLLLIFSQLHSGRWSKAILRRLEIV
ncbi:MAG: hypothetical protein ACYS6W_10150 [Planctomycetota bacterium]|jgi:hypothetical protein